MIETEKRARHKGGSRVNDHRENQTDQMPLAKQWSTPANIVTYIRIALVVIVMITTIMGGPSGRNNLIDRWIAVIIFVIAASTDKLDGYLARSRNEITNLGKLLDPIADKLLICSTLVILSCFNELWWWATLLFLIREIGITIMRFILVNEYHLVVPANQMGKIKTVLECVSLTFLLFPIWSLNFIPLNIELGYYYVTYALIGIALGVCLLSGGIYINAALEVYQSGNKHKTIKHKKHAARHSK